MPAERSDTDLPIPGFQAITILIRDDEPPSVDLGGVSPWAAFSLLYAIADGIWESLPDPVREGH